MIRLPIKPNRPHPDAIKQAVDVLKAGGVILYPTDTCYGLGVDARNKSAFRRLAAMKERDATTKPFSVIVRNIDQIRSIAKTDERIDSILAQNLPGPFTFALINLDFRIVRSSCIYVRIPNSPTTSMISAHFGQPYTTTSANISGLPSPYSYDEIETSLLSTLRKKNAPLPDLILDAGTLPHNEPSTIVDVTDENPKIIRQGSGEFRIKH